ncbi:hypothetical protein TNCV_586121 [Trichonephila clavipes]|nr:hypothetical protein TNCV_586121 [Trichonephila clavipes]
MDYFQRPMPSSFQGSFDPWEQKKSDCARSELYGGLFEKALSHPFWSETRRQRAQCSLTRCLMHEPIVVQAFPFENPPLTCDE